MVFVGHGAHHVLNGEATIDMVEVAGDVHVLQEVHQSRTLVPVHASTAVHHVVTLQRADGDVADVSDFELAAEILQLFLYPGENGLVVIHKVHLVDAEHHVRDAEQRSDEAVPAGLFQDPLACVHEDDGQVRGAGACDHVARVLDVPRCIGDDELAFRCGEVAVGYVDGDALLALSTQAIR